MVLHCGYGPRGETFDSQLSPSVVLVNCAVRPNFNKISVLSVVSQDVFDCVFEYRTVFWCFFVLLGEYLDVTVTCVIDRFRAVGGKNATCGRRGNIPDS